MKVAEAGLQQVAHMRAAQRLRPQVSAELQVGKLQAEGLGPDGPPAGRATLTHGPKVWNGEADLQNRVWGDHGQGRVDLAGLHLEEKCRETRRPVTLRIYFGLGDMAVLGTHSGQRHLQGHLWLRGGVAESPTQCLQPVQHVQV